MLIKFSTEKSLTAVSAALQLAAAAHHFVITQMHDLHETMSHIGEEDVRQCLVFEVGQLQEEKDFKQNPSIFLRVALSNFHVRGGQQDCFGYIETNHLPGANVSYSPTAGGGSTNGRHHHSYHETGDGRLIQYKLNHIFVPRHIAVVGVTAKSRQ